MPLTGKWQHSFADNQLDTELATIGYWSESDGLDFYALIESNIIYTNVIVIVIVIKQCSPPPPERINSQPQPLDSAFATGQRSGSNALKMDSMQTTQSIPPIEAGQYDVSSIHFHNNFKRQVV